MNTRTSSANPRVEAVVTDLVEVLTQFIRKHRVTHDEYHQAVAFLMECAKSEREIPLLLDVFLEMRVVSANERGGKVTESCVLGPFHVEGAPQLQPPYVLPHRTDEPGDPLVFEGTVRSEDGRPLAGAEFDLWQSDAEGRYSQFNFPEPRFNLRARFVTDAEGRFEARTFVPGPYEIPKDGQTGILLSALGRHTWRPAHLHLKLTHPGHRPLITQIYMPESPWLDSDVVGAVRPSLIARLEKVEDRAEIERHGLDRPFFRTSYDFVLAVDGDRG